MDMFTIYLAVFILGAVLLIIMAAMGGFADMAGDMDADVDVDADVDMDLDHDMDFDHDVDMDADLDLDHDHDFDTGGPMHGTDVNPSVLSLPVIFLAMVGFGGFGSIFSIMGFNPWLVPVLALVGGAFMAGAGFFILVKFFAIAQADSAVDHRTLIGMTGEVQIPILDGLEGRIMLITENRGRFLIGAVADEDIPTDSMVKVVALRGDAVKVRRLGKGRKAAAVGGKKTSTSSSSRTPKRKAKKKIRK